MNHLGNAFESLSRPLRPKIKVEGVDFTVKSDLGFPKRYKLQEQYVYQQLNSPQPERWGTYEGGDYTQPKSPILSKNGLLKLENDYPGLKGDELYIAHLITTMMENNLTVKPVGVMDAGGTDGMSWVRLARFFEQDILKKRLKLIVTNLHFNPSMLLGNSRSRFMREHPQNYPVWRDYHHLVAYINCTPKTFPDDVSLIYERDSITAHSLVPALERMLMMSKLISNGVLISRDHLLAHPEVPGQTDLPGILTREIGLFNSALAGSKEFTARRTVHINHREYKLHPGWQIIQKSDST